MKYFFIFIFSLCSFSAYSHIMDEGVSTNYSGMWSDTTISVDERRFIHNYPVYGASISKVRAYLYFMFTDYLFHYHYIDPNTDHKHRWVKISEEEYKFLAIENARFFVNHSNSFGSKIEAYY